MTSFQISLSTVDDLEMFVMKKKQGWSGRKGGEKLVKKVNGAIRVHSPILQDGVVGSMEEAGLEHYFDGWVGFVLMERVGQSVSA